MLAMRSSILDLSPGREHLWAGASEPLEELGELQRQRSIWGREEAGAPDSEGSRELREALHLASE